MKPCVFCGTTVGRATDEHVIPKWARRCFDLRGPVTISVGEEPGEAAVRRVASLQHLNITLRGRICGSCNNGFLSRLEQAVRPILAPMIVAARPRASLDHVEQALLATWAVKTVWLFELAVRQKLPTDRPIDGYGASELEFAWLWKNEEPPPRSFVWLGCWDCQQNMPVMYEPSGAPCPTPSGDPVVGHLTTFSLGLWRFKGSQLISSRPSGTRLVIGTRRFRHL